MNAFHISLATFTILYLIKTLMLERKRRGENQKYRDLETEQGDIEHATFQLRKQKSEDKCNILHCT